MTYKHWKELRSMLNEIADHYEEQRTLQKATEDIECNKGKTKEGATIKIGYMFTTYRKCSCMYLTPRDSSTWSDDEDDDSDELRDRGGRYQQFLPCGEMLVVSVALQENQPLSQDKESQGDDFDLQSSSGSQAERRTSFMSPARTDRQLLRALDSSIVFTNTISDYFESSQKKSTSQVLSENTIETAVKDKQTVLKNMACKSRMKPGKRKIGDSSASSHTSSENELPNKRQVTKSVFDTDSSFSYDTSPQGHDSENPDYIFTEDFTLYEHPPEVEKNSDNSLRTSKESGHSLCTDKSTVHSSANVFHDTQDDSQVSNQNSSTFGQIDLCIRVSVDKAKSPSENVDNIHTESIPTKDSSYIGDEKKYNPYSQAGNSMQTSPNKSCSPVLKRRSKNHTLSYLSQVTADPKKSKHDDPRVKRNTTTRNGKETSLFSIDKCEPSNLFSSDYSFTQDISFKSGKDSQKLVTPECQKKNGRSRKIKGHETIKAKMKLKVLFGDTDMPQSEMEDCNKKKNPQAPKHNLNEEHVAMPLKLEKSVSAPISAMAKPHSADDNGTFRRSHRIKKYKEKCALVEQNNLCDGTTSDLSTSESTSTEPKSQSSQGTDSPHTKGQLDNTTLNVSEVLISSRKVKKICSSAKTIKAIAELDRIRKDMEKLDELNNDDDLIGSSQNSCKDYVIPDKPKKKSISKKTKNIPLNQPKLDGWITPKEKLNRVDKEKEEVASKIKIKKSEVISEIKNSRKSEEVSKNQKSDNSDLFTKMKIAKKNEDRTPKTSEQKRSVKQRSLNSKGKDNKQDKKCLFSPFRTRKIESDESVSLKGSDASGNPSISSCDYDHTREKLENTNNSSSDKVLSDSNLGTDDCFPHLQNSEVSLADSLHFEKEYPNDSCSLPDLDFNRDCQSESDYDSSEAPDNCLTQDWTKSQDQRLSADDANSEDLNLRYDSSSPFSPHESCDKDDDLPTGNNTEVPQDSSPLPSLIAIHNRLSAMSLEDLDLRMQDALPYLKKIMKGQEPSRRHEIFRQGGREFRDIADELIFDPFSEEQILYAIECLQKEFSKTIVKACGKHKVTQYLWRVLAPTFFIKIVMENETLSSSEAERTLADISLNKIKNN
ncbi:uncharacterized protein LOC122257238 isoform X2 [Penaeus japonicus]|nr:uncharacterized protein LOC122257238 isoform X2 [Penaeus japonicus]